METVRDTRTHLYQEFANNLPPEVIAVVNLSALYQAGVSLSAPVDPDEDVIRLSSVLGYLDDVFAISKAIFTRKEAQVTSFEVGLENQFRMASAGSTSRVTDAAVKAHVQGNVDLAELKNKLALFEVFIDHLKNMRTQVFSRKDLTLEKSYDRRSLRSDKDR